MMRIRSVSLKTSLATGMKIASFVYISNISFCYSFQRKVPGSAIRAFTHSWTSLRKAISQDDIDYMNLALTHAKRGFGHTFPNPAVGCVLVRQDTNQVIGSGFHPQAGFPHAEVFALLEATGHIADGVQAAQAVVSSNAAKNSKRKEMEPAHAQLLQTIEQFTEKYASENGPKELFGKEAFVDFPVTAYVTLEPCCHYGKTPPCAASLALAKVSRVVVGFRDPNPSVDGGGVQLLRDANVDVDMMADSDEKDAARVGQACRDVVADFVKRITPRPKHQQDFSYITGAMRRSLRSLAGRKKSDNSLSEIDWTGKSIAAVSQNTDDKIDWDSLIASLALDPTWLERVDRLLWKDEIVLLRLNNAVKKKKAVKLLGGRIAEQLRAHVAQTVGHTCLLYRPGIPPVLDLNDIATDK
jgi:pyrimidine deaminase RibD-like protein/RNA-binding protein YhbY